MISANEAKELALSNQTMDISQRIIEQNIKNVMEHIENSIRAISSYGLMGTAIPFLPSYQSPIYGVGLKTDIAGVKIIKELPFGLLTDVGILVVERLRELGYTVNWNTACLALGWDVENSVD